MGALFAVALIIGTFWAQIVERLPAPIAAWFTTAVADSSAVIVTPVVPDTTARPDSASGTTPDSTAPDTAATGAASTDSAAGLVGSASTGVPTLANPADAGTAAKYAIFYTSANRREDAMVDVQVKDLPGLTVTPLMLDGTPWFRVFIGASPDEDGAKMLLAQLRARKLIGGGTVTSVPYALRLEGGVATAMVATRIAQYGKRGILAYSLQQANGSATLYTGAFESPAQAIMLSDSLRALGLTPVLAYRTGRAL